MASKAGDHGVPGGGIFDEHGGEELARAEEVGVDEMAGEEGIERDDIWLRDSVEEVEGILEFPGVSGEGGEEGIPGDDGGRGNGIEYSQG